MALTYKVESGIQLLARLTRKPVIDNFYPELFRTGPKQGDLVEMFSDEQLTPLLIDITCTALLPTCLQGVEAGVLIFNCSNHFNYSSFISVMKEKILTHLKLNKNLSESGSSDLEESDVLLKRALNNLYIMEIHDPANFYASIYNLENILMEHSSISILILDTVSAFYWSEQSFKIIKMDTYLKKILQKVQKITKEHKVTIFYTKPEYFTSNKDENLDSHQCYENATSERVDYKIHVAYINNSLYQANIKTLQWHASKQFCNVAGRIKWI